MRGNAATNNTPNKGGKFHRGKVKEVEMFQYKRSYHQKKKKRLICLVTNKLWSFLT
jgi:hypothetical protein